MISINPFLRFSAPAAALLLALAGSPATAEDVIFLKEAEAKKSAEAAAQAWAKVPEILARIVPPTFRPQDFIITGYGAKGDGETDCTAAFRRAIDDCNRDGGGNFSDRRDSSEK